jgi:hypothetical protein
MLVKNMNNRKHLVSAEVDKFDDIVKSQISDGFEKRPQARRANPEE